jgi:hypothetical protein
MSSKMFVLLFVNWINAIYSTENRTVSGESRILSMPSFAISSKEQKLNQG